MTTPPDLEAFRRELRQAVNTDAILQSLLYDLDMLPEQMLEGSLMEAKLLNLYAHWKMLIERERK